MKRNLLAVVLFSLFFVPSVAVGQQISVPDFPKADDFNFGNNQMRPVEDFTLEKGLGILALVLKVIYIVFFIYAALNVVWVAWDYLQSGGDSAKTKSAQQRLIYIAVAMAVALIALGVDNFVRNILDRT